MLKLLTIDQSFTNTAFIIWKGDKISKFGVIKSDKSDLIYERAKKIADILVAKVLDEKPEKVVVEQLAYGGFGNATRDLAGLLFVIVTNLVEKTHLAYEEIILVAPTSAKKAHTGSGRAKKEDMIAGLPDSILDSFSKHYKKTTGLADLADAYAFGQWYFQQNQKET